MPRKVFPCGHTGKGQFCHRCKQEAERARAKDEARRAWDERLAAAGIPLDGMPRPVVEKALQIIAAIRAGQSYLAFKGKRFVGMGQREVIAVPVGRRYRLVFREQDGALVCAELVSHETYNNRLAAGGWAS